MKNFALNFKIKRMETLVFTLFFKGKSKNVSRETFCFLSVIFLANKANFRKGKLFFLD